MNYQHLVAEEYIKRTISFDYDSDVVNTQPLNIAYGIDNNFLFGCGISIASILLHNSNIKFVFHIFIDLIEESELKKFSELASVNNTCIHIHIVNCDKLRLFPTTKNWSIATYFRFIIGDYFIGKQERILFIDADIMCKGDLSDLLTLPLDTNIAAVVPEKDHSWWEKRANSLDCPALKHGYFNAGFLLINISAWAQEYVSSRALAMLADKNIASKLSYLDQDLLNMILVDKVKFLDVRFNTQFSLNYELKSHVDNPIVDSTIFVHFIGPTKPWHSWANYSSAEPFILAKNSSPWREYPLQRPSSANYARYGAKHYFKQGNILSCIKYNLYYIYLKLKG